MQSSCTQYMSWFPVNFAARQSNVSFFFLLMFCCCRKHDQEPRRQSERRDFLWKRHRRPARGIINIWLWFDRCGLHRRDIWDYKALHRGYGEPGFRRSGAPPVRAGRFGSPRRLADHVERPQLRAARRCLPTWEVLPISSAHGHTLRSVPFCSSTCM